MLKKLILTCFLVQIISSLSFGRDIKRNYGLLDTIPKGVYEIIKIKRIKSAYIFYVINGNEKFKILSPREKFKKKKKKKIRIGNKFELVLFPFFDKNDLSNSIITHIMINGTPVPLIDEWGANFYSTFDFKGKYYIPPQ